MIELIAFSGIFLVLLCLLIWAALRRVAVDHIGEQGARLPIEFLMPRKTEEFAQAQRLLAEIRSEAKQKHLSPAERGRLLRERDKIARELLTALHEDFIRLDRLMCAVAAVSPEVSRQKEVDRLLLSLRFGARYRLALVSLFLGAVPVGSIPGLQILLKVRAQNLRTFLKAVDLTLLGNLIPAKVLQNLP